MGGAADSVAHLLDIPDVGDLRADSSPMPAAKPVDVVGHVVARETIEQQHVAALRGQPVGEIGADEAGPAGNQHVRRLARHGLRVR